jgi:hypothetical protein
VDTIVRPPVAPTTPPVAERRRPWPRRLALIAIVIVVAILIAAVIWIANYDPFIPGTRGYGPQDPRIRVTEVDALGTYGWVYDFPAGGRRQGLTLLDVARDDPILGLGHPTDGDVRVRSRREDRRNGAVFLTS